MRQVFRARVLLIALFLLWPCLLLAKTARESDRVKAGDKGGISYDFDEEAPLETETADDAFLPDVDQLFKNPALASGLASGVDAVNHSLESMMEGVFYNLMDNDLTYHFNDTSLFRGHVQRDIYSTTSGAYVVVDRFAMGPEAQKNITQFNGNGIPLGADARVEVLDIYLQTDAARVAKNAQLPFWRRTVNNWFGLLPLLTSILPPSFNPNQLYDPLRELETPFMFPGSIEGFRSMPLGSIRSIGYVGTLHLPIDIGTLGDQAFRHWLQTAENSAASLPYTMFVEGEHRINVLRRDENHAWVGVSTVKRAGHSFVVQVGRTFYLLNHVIPYWRGVPGAVYPIDLTLTQLLKHQFDQVYSYDLRRKEARDAYLAAVTGDFTLSAKLAAQVPPTGEQPSVIYFFTRTGQGPEVDLQNTRNLAFLRNGRTQTRTKEETEITDDRGKFYVLEAAEDTQDDDWNVLLGSRQTKVKGNVAMDVSRNPDVSGPKYQFLAEKNPLVVTFAMSLQDPLADSKNYEQYVQTAREFTGMALEELPIIPLRDEAQIALRRKRLFFEDPLQDHLNIHATPLELGHFSYQAAIAFPTDAIERIVASSEDAKWQAFATVFGRAAGDWDTAAQRQSFLNQAEWLRAAALYPLRLFNLRFEWADAIKEATQAVQRLDKIAAAKTPLDKLEAFYDLFDTDYPVPLARALVILAGPESLARRVTFHTHAKANLPAAIGTAFKALDGKRLASVVPFPPSDRYTAYKDKLSQFYPQEVKAPRASATITKVLVDTQPLLSDLDTVVPDTDKAPAPVLVPDQVHVRLHVKNIVPEAPWKLYVRLEQAGKLEVGKFVLGEDVLSVDPTSIGFQKDPKNPREGDFSFFLTGPESPLQSFLMDRAMSSGGEFVAALAVSTNGDAWSPERILHFRYTEGKLTPPGT